jgi:hypothetical protein
MSHVIPTASAEGGANLDHVPVGITFHVLHHWFVLLVVLEGLEDLHADQDSPCVWAASQHMPFKPSTMHPLSVKLGQVTEKVPFPRKERVQISCQKSH